MRLQHTEWTNEKHSLYLKTMEASFIDQLYESLDRYTENNLPRSIASKNKRIGQFLCQGRRSRLGFWSDEAELNQKNKKSRVLPRVIHTEEAGELSNSNVKASSIFTCQSPNDYQHRHHKVSIQSNAEVIDQNFTDEALEEKKSIRRRKSKRRGITSTSTMPSTDQIVPSR